MKLINTNQSKKATFSLALSVILFFAGLTQVAAQEAQSVTSNANATPALMLSFTGVVNETAGQLTWVTENETSAKWFVVERSETGNNFDSIGRVMCVNNGNMTTYNYEDNSLTGGSNYYRLREVDNDGIARYSKIISLNDANVATKMQVYPNPASAVVNFAVNSNTAGQMSVKIYNLAGVLVSAREQAVEAGISQQSVAISNLKTGSYIIRITGKSGMQYTQMFSKI
jgi:Secretion system C-terminal sorting domain